MNSVWIVLISFAVFGAAYRFYGRFIAKRIFRADPDNPVPSEELRDDIDYVPTNKEILFGHHFASIAGTGPIVGPAIAIIWGWVPALVWIILGSIFAGAVHDYAALIMSTRKKGVSIGELSREVINPRVRILFLFVILFALWVVVAIFGMVMAVIFNMYPQAVLPVWIQIPIAMTVGWLAYRKKFNMTVMSVIAVILMYASMVIGVRMPLVMPALWGLSPMAIWIILLFSYAYFASVLPVWSLLQPRDYVNSHQLIIGLALIMLGVIFARPVMVAPALQMAPAGAPPILPFLFISVACGAISGFHALVGSGTSSKQLKSEEDVRFIAYGGMLTEGLLAVLVLVAVGAGIGMYVKAGSGEVLRGAAAWQYHYSSWTAAQGLTAKVTAFVNGAANMLGALGIPLRYGQAVIGVLIASFAGTTLDTATRIQRYVVTELAVDYNIRPLQGRHPATALAVLAAAALAFAQGGGKGALILWPLFGTSNQLLAGLVLLVASVYLIKKGANAWPTVVPMLFMIITSSWAMLSNLGRFFNSGQWHLVVIGSLILLLEAWMIFEAAVCIKTQFHSGSGHSGSGYSRSGTGSARP
ncbi:MAG: carbon starvation protein A [Candidatus Makaraimicrobium thalassicum]|nr:MAG: carbon starvation protein A [Candidatus Omnitrophota bacterium]